MSDEAASYGASSWQPAAPPSLDSPGVGVRRDLRAAAIIIAVLVVLGALLGLVWQWWSPVQPSGYVVAPHAIEPLTEAEEWVGADGRFFLIGAAVGISAAVTAWLVRSIRGPIVGLALGIGGLLGALATDLIGYAVRGGSGDGKVGTVLHHLPLEVRAREVLLAEAILAVLLYSILVAFAGEDDLGRPDPEREVAWRATHPVVPSYGAWPYGDVPAPPPVWNLPPGHTPPPADQPSPWDRPPL